MRRPFVAAILILFASTALAQSYPSEIPKDFKNAPGKLICERKKPTAVHEKTYYDDSAKTAWIVTVAGRDHKDLSVNYSNYGRTPRVSFAMTQSGWKNVEGLNKEDRAYLVKSGFYFTYEEGEFITNCRLQKLK